jgi:hypothetical protein
MNKTGGLKTTASKIKRPGVHSKKRTSNNKNSKNYVKQYRGQGK